jgi:RimJ/RimL family protein N-acetyltransferase
MHRWTDRLTAENADYVYLRGVVMKELEKAQFRMVYPFMNEINCDTVYAYSIVENRQYGRIFVDNVESPNTVLLWHYCGFAYIIGEFNDDFNWNICRLLSGEFEDKQRHFILHVNDKKWNETIVDITKNKCNIKKDERYLFRFKKELYENKDFRVSNSYIMSEIDEKILSKLDGMIIPSFSWHTSEAFLKGGKGFCLIDNNDISCSAFSSGIGNGQIDIGVETHEEYRGKGLGTMIAAEMVKYALRNGFEPTWGCNVKNLASAAIAGKLGFERIAPYSIYIKA